TFTNGHGQLQRLADKPLGGSTRSSGSPASRPETGTADLCAYWLSSPRKMGLNRELPSIHEPARRWDGFSTRPNGSKSFCRGTCARQVEGPSPKRFSV